MKPTCRGNQPVLPTCRFQPADPGPCLPRILRPTPTEPTAKPPRRARKRPRDRSLVVAHAGDSHSHRPSTCHCHAASSPASSRAACSRIRRNGWVRPTNESLDRVQRGNSRRVGARPDLLKHPDAPFTTRLVPQILGI